MHLTQTNHDENSGESLKNARSNLYEKYNEIEEEPISIKVDQIDRAQHDNQYKLRWKFMNEISGRKATRNER